MFDLKLTDYDEPILVPNLQTNHQFLNSKFLSDVFLAEDVPKENESDHELFQSLVNTI